MLLDIVGIFMFILSLDWYKNRNEDPMSCCGYKCQRCHIEQDMRAQFEAIHSCMFVLDSLLPLINYFAFVSPMYDSFLSLSNDEEYHCYLNLVEYVEVEMDEGLRNGLGIIWTDLSTKIAVLVVLILVVCVSFGCIWIETTQAILDTEDVVMALKKEDGDHVKSVVDGSKENDNQQIE
eukprot:5595_1